MNKIVAIVLVSSIGIFSTSQYSGSTLAPVVISGGIIKAQNTEAPNKKYKRKDCPVCKGKGWYISGDGIKKVDCGYCEPETNEESSIIIRR